MRLSKQTPTLPNVDQSLKKNSSPFGCKGCFPHKNTPPVYVIVHPVSRTVRNVGLTVEVIIYGFYISRHVTIKATVVLFKVYESLCAAM